MIYSNYAVCLFINTLDQPSLGKLKEEKQRHQAVETDRKRRGGWELVGSDKASRGGGKPVAAER